MNFYLTNFIFDMLNKVPKIANHFPSSVFIKELFNKVDDRINYDYLDIPRHIGIYYCSIDFTDTFVMIISVSRYAFKNAEIVGDVLAIFMDHFNIVNEFSNEFWGWGGGDEADEMGKIAYFKVEHDMNV
ncbi:unnamed protein product [Onchocerca flexuosa]|uniref:Glyco_transf_7C domain-containing protein n=1 Tax=Onchocerca flexuosa TaxID=387005 RepID=A0A183H8V5_9BILA|nr:unnamed protein product [Onchocerca flexuosa]